MLERRLQFSEGFPFLNGGFLDRLRVWFLRTLDGSDLERRFLSAAEDHQRDFIPLRFTDGLQQVARFFDVTFARFENDVVRLQTRFLGRAPFEDVDGNHPPLEAQMLLQNFGRRIKLHANPVRVHLFRNLRAPQGDLLTLTHRAHSDPRLLGLRCVVISGNEPGQPGTRHGERGKKLPANESHGLLLAWNLKIPCEQKN